MAHRTKVLLIAGGQGTRLWPKSRRAKPKQFMSLADQPSLFQQALQRAKEAVPQADLFVVAPVDYAPLIQEQAPHLTESQLFLEPTARGTMPALIYALLRLQQHLLRDSDVIVMLPADAYIDDQQAFSTCLQTAIETAQTGQGLVTIGVKPLFPATGYGYIRVAAPTPGMDTDPRLANSEQICGEVLPVESFVEKPDRQTAATYLQDGHYFWNAGIFVWTVTSLIHLLDEHQPELLTSLRWAETHLHGRPDQLAQWYATLPKLAVEHALVEHTKTISMVPANFAWADLGTWSELLAKTAFVKPGLPVFMMEASNNLAYSDHGLVGLFGVDNLIVIRAEDVVFVCHRDREQEVKNYLALLEKTGFGGYL